MMTRFTKSIFFLLVGILFAVPTLGHAQFTDDYTQESIIVTVTPENPQPQETVTFSVTSYVSNLDRATISWYVNGKKAAGAVGMRTFSTKIGNVGSNTTVEVVVSTFEGNTIRQTIPFKAASVDLIWEADSYVPPLYKGKALFSAYQTGRVVAIPQLGPTSSTLSPTNLIYTWKRDGRVIGSASGYGKNVFEISEAMTARPTTIGVTVSNQAGTINAEETITIQPTRPKIVTYLNTPAFGTLYNTAFQGTVRLSSKELNIAAVPFFFSATKSTSPYIRYDWMMNNTSLTTAADSILTLRNTATTTGSTNITSKATVESGNSIQTDTTSFTISY